MEIVDPSSRGPAPAAGPVDPTGLGWARSSYSNGAGGMCVEVARLPGGHVMVRDSKAPAGLALTFSRGEWLAFINGVRAGEFDPA